MNWDAVGAIAEIVGAIGVIGSLIYLSLQVRQNNAYIRNQALFDTVSELRQAIGRMIEDADLSRIYFSGRSRYPELNESDRGRFHLMIFEILSIFENYIEFGAADMIKPETAALPREQIEVFIEEGWFADYWSAFGRRMFDRGFVREVDEIIHRHGA